MMREWSYTASNGVDSIAVSIFVVMLVDFDKYWDEQSCLNGIVLGYTSQYIPPLGSVHIQYPYIPSLFSVHCFGEKFNTFEYDWIPYLFWKLAFFRVSLSLGEDDLGCGSIGGRWRPSYLTSYPQLASSYHRFPDHQQMGVVGRGGFSGRERPLPATWTAKSTPKLPCEPIYDQQWVWLGRFQWEEGPPTNTTADRINSCSPVVSNLRDTFANTLLLNMDSTLSMLPIIPIPIISKWVGWLVGWERPSKCRRLHQQLLSRLKFERWERLRRHQ